MPGTRKNKLVMLREMADLETGMVNTNFFEYENSIYDKAVRMKSVNNRIRRCKKCPGMNLTRFTENCPGWGDLNAKILFVGQSLHSPGVASHLPFIKGCGYSLDAALRLSGLLRKDVFITNVIHCHPEGNRSSTLQEKENCLAYLKQEVEIVSPALIVALGNDAREAVKRLPGVKNMKALFIKHPAAFMYGSPESRIEWILKLSKEIDKVYKDGK